MSHRVVLNHYSLPYICRNDADIGLLIFFRVLKECRAAGLKIILVDEDQDKSLMGIKLTEEYYIRNWFNIAKNVPESTDWCRFLRLIETKQPLFETTDLDQINGSIEVGLNGEKAGKSVLLAAFFFNEFLVSFNALANWARTHIDVWILDINATPGQKRGSLLNLYDETSLVAHRELLNQRRNELINNAKDIWTQRHELFPHLVFLENQIGTSLRNWSARQDILVKARDCLNVLETFCAKWKAGQFADYRHQHLVDLGLAAEVSGESSSVANDPQKRKERLFWLEDGRSVYCENHLKLPAGFRMHFYPDANDKCIYIAYLGPHLTL